MAIRKLFNERDAKRCVRAVQAWSRAWVKARGAEAGALNGLRVKPARLEAVRPKLVELIPTRPYVVSRGSLLVRVGGVELEVLDGFDEQSLRRLVGLLKSC